METVTGGCCCNSSHGGTYEDDLRVEVSALWAEDWDSEDDAVYDDW